ncbi:formate dehydrogenase accessory sulfurtransferase FdhD [Herbaspirillum sp. HC18]|nr:formate dehydrogenase accessory sulfurtransferase FdhD [Herbaspirillum sp. HC18]
MRRDDAPAVKPVAGMRRVGSHRFPAAGQPAVDEDCWVVEEQALFLDVEDVGLYTLMWTRGDIAYAAGFMPDDGVLGETPVPEALALCVGFLLTEGMIDNTADIASLAVCPDSPEVVKVRLVDPARSRSNRRGGLVASSCGVCGGVESAADLRAGLLPVADTLRIDMERFAPLMAAMRERQSIFNTTGGTHAVALFSSEAVLIACAEDLGRHNALDKVIGQCLLREQVMTGCGVLLSGRVSLEMIVKAARAGIELVAAVSAPSSLAIEAADRLGITLCGFVRQGRVTVFTHSGRLG